MHPFVRETLRFVAGFFAILLFAFGLTAIAAITVGLPPEFNDVHLSAKDAVWGISTAGLICVTLWALKQR